MSWPFSLKLFVKAWYSKEFTERKKKGADLMTNWVDHL